MFGYDAFDNNRELAQAENIYKHTLKNHPSAKVLVYSGGSHFSKDSTSKLMGYYFKEMSGVDAFLVNQLKLADTQYDLCAHQGDQYNILAINNIKETDFKIDPLKDQFLTTINIPIDTIQEKGQKRILSIYIRDEYHAYRLQAIPVWNFMLTKTEKVPVYLPKGVYVFVIRNETGTILKQMDFTI